MVTGRFSSARRRSGTRSCAVESGKLTVRSVLRGEQRECSARILRTRSRTTMNLQTRKRCWLAALTMALSVVQSLPVEAGIVPWMWDTVFGPVGSIRARRCGVGYGPRAQCNFGPSMCSPCGGGGCSPCSSGMCGTGYGYAGMGGGCATGQCGVNFSPDMTPGNLAPQVEPNIPRANPAPKPPDTRPTYREDENLPPRPGNSGSSIDNNLGGSDEHPLDGTGDSAIENKNRNPVRPSPLDRLKEEGNLKFPPMEDALGNVTWSTQSELSRQGGRELKTRSVEVTRRAAYPNSKWEVISNRAEVAKK